MTGRPPDPRLFARYCRGKVGFTSKRAANGVRRVMVAGGASQMLNAYRCEACHKWHLGKRR